MTIDHPARASELERHFATFTGEAITPDHPDYADARVVWNGMTANHPQLIARCRTVGDIVSAVLSSRSAGVFPAVRGGGHSVAGLSTSDGVVIDLMLMRDVSVDVPARRALASGGATWGDYDVATGTHGLASTGGLISSTGVAGLTLGGGIGWLQRRHGLACDNLVGAEVVTATGEVVRAGPDDDTELLWGLRGGGGNFGIVSSFEFALHPVSTVYAGMMLFPWDRATEVLTAFGAWTRGLPDEASMLAAVMTAPPEPFVPADLVGQPALAIVGCWCGALDEGATALESMRSLGPAVDLFGPMPYVGLQTMLDGDAPFGLRNYFRTGFLDTLDDASVARIVEHGGRLPSPMSQIHLHQMGGKVRTPDSVGSAFAGRDAGFTYNLVSTWTDPLEDDVHVDANRRLDAELSSHASSGQYVNFMTDRDGVRDAYGAQVHDRLVALKRRLDPGNFFRVNQNIAP